MSTLTWSSNVPGPANSVLLKRVSWIPRMTHRHTDTDTDTHYNSEKKLELLQTASFDENSSDPLKCLHIIQKNLSWSLFLWIKGRDQEKGEDGGIQTKLCNVMNFFVFHEFCLALDAIYEFEVETTRHLERHFLDIQWRLQDLQKKGKNGRLILGSIKHSFSN